MDKVFKAMKLAGTELKKIEPQGIKDITLEDIEPIKVGIVQEVNISEVVIPRVDEEINNADVGYKPLDIEFVEFIIPENFFQSTTTANDFTATIVTVYY